MKKVVSCLFTCTLAIMMSFSSVFAYDTSKIDSSYEKLKSFYESKEELRSYDEIIAVESIGLEAENYKLPDMASVDYENETLGNSSKGIISFILIGENPRNYNGKNLIELLENCIQEDGSVEKDGFVATSNVQVWVLYALESYNSDKVGLVANNLLSTMNVDGSFGYGYGNSSADVTGWCLEALSIAGLSDQLNKTQEYLNNNSRFGDKGIWGYSYQDADYDENGKPTYKVDNEGNPIVIDVPNATSQAAVLIGLITNDKEELLNGRYDYNSVNPLDTLAELQNEDGTYWDDKNTSYETFDTVRAIGTYKNGSIIYKVQKDYKELITKPKENKPAEQSNTEQTVTTNKKEQGVQTGDDTQTMIYVSVAMISSGLYLILRKEYERVH